MECLVMALYGIHDVLKLLPVKPFSGVVPSRHRLTTIMSNDKISCMPTLLAFSQLKIRKSQPFSSAHLGKPSMSVSEN